MKTIVLFVVILAFFVSTSLAHWSNTETLTPQEWEQVLEDEAAGRQRRDATAGPTNNSKGQQSTPYASLGNTLLSSAQQSFQQVLSDSLLGKNGQNALLSPVSMLDSFVAKFTQQMCTLFPWVHPYYNLLGTILAQIPNYAETYPETLNALQQCGKGKGHQQSSGLANGQPDIFSRGIF
jgi:hypothetical protein